MIDKDEILRTAALARLAIRDEEAERLAAEMARVLAFVERIRGIEVGAVVAETPIPGGAETLRPDVVLPGLDHDAALGNAPAVIDGFFRVPRVVAEP